MATPGGDRHDHMVARLQPLDTPAKLAHNAGALVAADHWQLALSQSGHHRQIRMAQTGCAHLDEDLTLAGPLHFDVLESERLTFDIGLSPAPVHT